MKDGTVFFVCLGVFLGIALGFIYTINEKLDTLADEVSCINEIVEDNNVKVEDTEPPIVSSTFIPDMRCTTTSKKIDIITITVDMTAYCPDKRCCWGDPWETAFGTRVRKGIIAISRDLEKQYNLKKGDIIHTEFGDFVVEDRMGRTARGKPIKKTIDIWFPTCKEAKMWGRKKGEISFENRI